MLICALRAVCGNVNYRGKIPTSAHPLLQKQLDWDNQTDRDLIEIASNMLDWEENLCTHLGLKEVDIRDIKDIHPGKPDLQR